MRAEMAEGRNTTLFHFNRPSAAGATGKQLPADCDVRLTVRVDIEDRNFHSETKRNSGAEYHFVTNTSAIQKSKTDNQKFVGFSFTPAADRQLRVFAAVPCLGPRLMQLRPRPPGRWPGRRRQTNSCHLRPI